MKPDKSLLIITVFILSLVLLQAEEIALNQSGQFVPKRQKAATAEHFLQETDYYLNIAGNILKGNSVYHIENGYLTLTTLEENVPSMVRIYGPQGNLRFAREFRRTVNFTISPAGNFSAFYCENGIVRISHQELETSAFNGNNVFALNDQGDIASYYKGNILFKGSEITCPEIPRKLAFQGEDLIAFTARNIFRLENEDLQLIEHLNGTYFDSRITDDEIYYVVKNANRTTVNYTLLKTGNNNERLLIDEVEINRELTRTHDPIPSPLNYGEVDYPFMIGNSYGALQEYGQALYMHPGVDFNGEDYQEVYAVKDGYVKAVITTGGAAYWRIAIANEDTADACEGYLYAHLNQGSITVAVGDTVYAGDLLGTLYDWQVLDFTHIHFARIIDEGEVWNGAWWTTDSPQIDFTNVRDTIPPNLEITLNNDLFAFRNEAGDYLDPENLSGEFDIIAKCHDYCNSPWAQGPYDMWFSVANAFYPDDILYEHPHLVWDMPTDVYNVGQYSFLCVNTFYSRDETLFSTVGYDYIEAYHIVTNADDDPEVNELDAAQMFDSAQFADGLYMIYVHARDQSLNETVGEMMVTFNNGVDAGEEDIPEIKEVKLSNYPNPFNPTTRIYFEIPESGNVQLDIYNSLGQLVCNLENEHYEAGEHFLDWQGLNQQNEIQSSGIYFYKLHYKDKQYTKKMMILK